MMKKNYVITCFVVIFGTFSSLVVQAMDENEIKKDKISRLLANKCSDGFDVQEPAANTWYLRQKNETIFKDLTGGNMTHKGVLNNLKNNISKLKSTKLVLNDAETEFVDEQNKRFEDRLDALEDDLNKNAEKLLLLNDTDRLKEIKNFKTKMMSSFIEFGVNYQNYLGRLAFNQQFNINCGNKKCDLCSTLIVPDLADNPIESFLALINDQGIKKDFAFNSLNEIPTIKKDVMNDLEKSIDEKYLGNLTYFKEKQQLLEEHKKLEEDRISKLKSDRQIQKLMVDNKKTDKINSLEESQLGEYNQIESSAHIKIIQNMDIATIKNKLMPNLSKIVIGSLLSWKVIPAISQNFIKRIRSSVTQNSSLNEMVELIDDMSVKVENFQLQISKFYDEELKKVNDIIKHDEAESMKKISVIDSNIENKEKGLKDTQIKFEKVKNIIQEYDLLKEHSDNFDLKLDILTNPQIFFPLKDDKGEEITGECLTCSEENVIIGKMCPLQCNYTQCMSCAKKVSECPGCRTPDFSKF